MEAVVTHIVVKRRIGIAMIDLHVHSKYSLLDAIIEPEELVLKAKEDGKEAVCFTDHGNIMASVETYKLCQEHDIKFILGCEFYICGDVEVKDPKDRYNHLIIWAKNEQGRKNINRLVSLSTQYKYYGKPRIDWEMLKQHKEGLIVSTACMAGEMSRVLMGRKKQENMLEEDIAYRETSEGRFPVKMSKKEMATAIAKRYKDEFGEDFYIEIQAHDNEEQLKLNEKLVEIANNLNIEIVVTTDAHYLTEDEQKYHDIWVQIGTTREAGEVYDGCYIMNEQEVRNIISKTLNPADVERAISNTHIIANKCNSHIPLKDPQLPHMDIPEEFDGEMEYMKYLCAKGWVSKGIVNKSKEEQEVYKERLLYELDVLDKMGYMGYFVIVHGYKAQAYEVGIARGSAGGSLVAYLMNITDIDPILHGLYFERFLDVSALKLLEDGVITKSELKIPDIDLDFGDKARQDVMDYVIEEHGRDKVCALGTFQYTWAKGAIKDIGKILGIPYETTNKIAKKIDGSMDFKEVMEQGVLDEYKDDYPELFDYAQKLSGLPKSFGTHACGIVLSNNTIVDMNAVDMTDSMPVLMLDMHGAEDLGMVKFDFLGLKTVDIIYDTLELLGKTDDYIAPHNIDWNDQRVWAEFEKGNTELIFQFSSEGMKGTLQGMKANSIHDLTVANALYRPGSMAFISDYTRRKAGLEEPQYLHPDLKPILESTYGIIVFQEQLIEVGKLAKLQNPDILRKATGKKDVKLMAKVKPELTKGLIDRGWAVSQVDELWDIMIEFSKYSLEK